MCLSFHRVFPVFFCFFDGVVCASAPKFLRYDIFTYLLATCACLFFSFRSSFLWCLNCFRLFFHVRITLFQQRCLVCFCTGGRVVMIFHDSWFFVRFYDFFFFRFWYFSSLTGNTMRVWFMIRAVNSWFCHVFFFCAMDVFFVCLYGCFFCFAFFSLWWPII